MSDDDVNWRNYLEKFHRERPGVTEAVLACGFLPDTLREALGEGEHAEVKLSYVVEPERRGTAGAIRFAADSLGERLEERFLALNGDVLADLDLSGPAFSVSLIGQF